MAPSQGNMRKPLPTAGWDVWNTWSRAYEENNYLCQVLSSIICVLYTHQAKDACLLNPVNHRDFCKCEEIVCSCRILQAPLLAGRLVAVSLQNPKLQPNPFSPNQDKLPSTQHLPLPFPTHFYLEKKEVKTDINILLHEFFWNKRGGNRPTSLLSSLSWI